jgi:hypothetical protein
LFTNYKGARGTKNNRKLMQSKKKRPSTFAATPLGIAQCPLLS